MKRWQFWLGVLISGFFLYLVLRKLHWAEFWEALKTANYWWLLPGVAVYFVGVWVRAWRWHYLLRPLKSIPTRTMFPIVAIGYMGNNIYPARAGEVLRAVVLKRREGVPISASLATMIVERIFDGVVMLAFVFVNLAELSRLADVSLDIGRWNVSVQDVALWGSVAFFGALAVFLAAAMFPRPADRFVTWGVNRFIPLRLREKTLSRVTPLPGRARIAALAYRCVDGVFDFGGDLAAGDGQVLVRDACFPGAWLSGIVLCADADERGGQPGDHAAGRARLCGHIRCPRRGDPDRLRG